jgi:DNA polymerase
MPVFGDIETCSAVDLGGCGAFRYVTDPSTDVLLLCFAVDDGPVQVWKPGDPVPAPYTDPAKYAPFVWDNWNFDGGIYNNILVARYGFAPIPSEQQDCAERQALACGYPAELGKRCAALGPEYRKDPEARKAMLRLSRLQPAKKRKPKKTDKATPEHGRERDLALLLERCKTDVESTRACYNKLPPLSADERRILLLDAKVNARGVCLNVPFIEAARAVAIQERNAVNVRLSELTSGVVTSVFQRDRLLKAINDRGHNLTTLGKRSVAAALAHGPEDVRELLALRQRGALNSMQKFTKMLAFADPVDHRVREVLRYHGTHTGRWSCLGVQLHNLPRNDAELPASLLEAVLAGDRTEIARWGNPLTVLAGLTRAALRATVGHLLMWGDLATIEPRTLAWLADEQWKLEGFREYDASGDERLHPYRQIAARMLRKDVLAIVKPERQLGKSAEIAFGYGGVVGAWQRIVDDGRSEAEIKAINRQWRDAHPQTLRFWDRLMRTICAAIRGRQAVRVNPAPAPSIVADFDGATLTLELPSGRRMAYPGARLIPNQRFEDGDPDVEYLDNAKGQWSYRRAWFGVFAENVTSGVSRDLLAAALLRIDARGWPIVSHCHDEITIEAADGTVSEQELLACMLEAPPWAEGLPIGGKVHSGQVYFEGPATAEPPAATLTSIGSDAAAVITQGPAAEVGRALDAFVAEAAPLPDTEEVERGAEEIFLENLDATNAPLTALVSLPLDSSNRVACPFHDDHTPSCSIYADHYHCHSCGRHGSRIDWLTQVEGMTRAEALAALVSWDAPPSAEQRSTEDKLAFAREIWNATRPLKNTIAERYLAETRGIAVDKLPPTISEVLRFHPDCVFGSRRVPCLIARMQDPLTGATVGIHRIGLDPGNGAVRKLDRMALGHMGVVRLWPVNGEGRLVVGEGIETTLAAATRIPFQGAPLTPAWSAVARGGLARLPVLPGVTTLIQLIDHDTNNAGQSAAARGRQTWTAAGRKVVPLIPKQAGWDFNDVVLRRKS